MEESKRKKTESIVFTAGLFVVAGLLVYRGGIKNIAENLSVVLPVFGAALIIFCVPLFWVKLCALILFWIPSGFILKTVDYALLFLPIVSLVFAASCINSVREKKKAVGVPLALAAVLPLVCVIYNASLFSLRSYFSGRWNKLVILLVLFSLVFAYLYLLPITTNKNRQKEKTVIRYSKTLLAVAVADLAIGIETLFQFMWMFTTIHHLYCLAWLLFFAAIIRYEMPQAVRLLHTLKLK